MMSSSPVKRLLEDAKRNDLLLPPNTFSLSRFAFDEGIFLHLNKPDPWKPGEVLSPNLTIGGRFITRDKRPGIGCIYHPEIRGGLVRRASVRQIHPIQGGNSFSVLVQPDDIEKTCLLYVMCGEDTRHQLRYKKKVLAQSIFHGAFGTATTILQDERNDSSLFQFSKTGQEVSVMYPDGYVTRVVYEGGTLVCQNLSESEMLTVRIEGASRALKECGEDATKRRGILIGLVNLLQVLRKSDSSVQEVLCEFLLKQNLSQWQIERMRNILIAQNVLLGMKYFAKTVPMRVCGGRASAHA